MKKILLALVVLGATAFCSFAQQTSSDPKFSVGLDAGLPLGTAKQVYNVALGISLKYEIPVADNLFATASAGYEAFLTKILYKDAGASSSDGAIPLKAGLKYYFNEGFFGEAQVGAAISTQSGDGTAFAYAPGIGYSFDGGFELGARYEGWAKNGTISQIALRVAYRF